MNPTLHALLVVSSTFLIFAAFIVTFVIVANRLAKRSVRRKIERLRQSGVLPNPGSDEDIIRLANEEKREEAALLYVALHGGDLETARILVGKKTWATTFGAIAFVIVFLACVVEPLVLGRHYHYPLVGVWVTLAIVMVASMKRSRKNIEANRATLAKGRLPEMPARK